MGDQEQNDPGKEEKERTRLAALLKETREYLGFSQDQVAQHLGVPRSALSNIENGQRKVAVVELMRLAALYKRPVNYFTGEVGPPADALPEDVRHLAREATKLTEKDRAELSRFAEFLRARAGAEPNKSKGGN